jgi:hypothetical protein
LGSPFVFLLIWKSPTEVKGHAALFISGSPICFYPALEVYRFDAEGQG